MRNEELGINKKSNRVPRTKFKVSGCFYFMQTKRKTTDTIAYSSKTSEARFYGSIDEAEKYRQ